MGRGALFWQGGAALGHVPENHLLFFQQEQDLLVLLLQLFCKVDREKVVTGLVTMGCED